MKRIISLTFSILLIILLTSSSSKKNQPTFFKDNKNYALIPAGTFLSGVDTIKMNSFYIFKYEISNINYREFIASLEQNKRTEDLKIALPDTLKWRDQLAYNEPYVEFYFRHPAYNNYPVVGVSYEAANMFCKWLETTLNSKEGIDYQVEVRLPTKDEWKYAAHGGLQLSPYAWGGPYLRDSRGCFQANFTRIDEGNIHYNPETKQYEVIARDFGIAGSLNDAADITAPVSSYTPNNYGLYNCCGNVAEMISEKGIAMGGSWKSAGYDIRIDSEINYSEPSTTVGFRPLMIVKQKK